MIEGLTKKRCARRVRIRKNIRKFSSRHAYQLHLLLDAGYFT